MAVDRLKTEMADRAALLGELVDRLRDGILDAVSQHTTEQPRAGPGASDPERRDLGAVMDLLWNRIRRSGSPERKP